MPNQTPGESSKITSNLNRIHRINECCQILGIGRSTYYKLCSEGVIEPSIKISKRARGHTGEYLNNLIQKMGGGV